MHKGRLLNAQLQHCIATMGHTDMLVICDAGLPIPDTTQRIDLALTHNIPSFLDTLDTVIATLYVEKISIAEEIRSHNEPIHRAICERLAALSKMQGNEIAVEYIPHEQFKQRAASAKGIVRTGECSPYANIIIHAGVVF